MTDKDKLLQQLSMLVDDECKADERSLALRRLAREPELSACWQRYNLIGDAMSNQLPDQVDVDFSRRVLAAIEAEPEFAGAALVEPKRPATRRWRYAAAAAIAAVVGVAAVTAFQTQNAPGNPRALAGTAEQPAPVQTVTSPADRVVRLNDYLADHNEMTSANSVHGVLPFVRTVAYGGGRR